MPGRGSRITATLSHLTQARTAKQNIKKLQYAPKPLTPTTQERWLHPLLYITSNVIYYKATTSYSTFSRQLSLSFLSLCSHNNDVVSTVFPQQHATSLKLLILTTRRAESMAAATSGGGRCDCRLRGPGKARQNLYIYSFTVLVFYLYSLFSTRGPLLLCHSIPTPGPAVCPNTQHWCASQFLFFLLVI